MEEEEIKIIRDIPKCQWDLQFYNYIGKLNLDILKKEFAEHFFNYHLMEVIRCIINAIIVNDQDVVFSDLNIHHWFDKITILSQDNMEGDIFISKLKTITDFLILKVPKEEGSLFHDLFVGLLGLNQLRQYIPNFVFTYGIFSCSAPFLEEPTSNYRSPLTWCHPSSHNTNYIVYEYIPSIGTFEDYLQKCTFTQFLDKYLQVLLSIRMAGEICKFTHYDLHGGNVLLRKPPPSLTGKIFYLPYTYEDKTYYIKTDYIATIIDFGFSRIEYKGKTYNSNNPLPDDNLFFPLQDAYTLLIQSLYGTMEGRDDLYRQIFPIILFFYEIDINDPITGELRYLPPDKFTTLTINDLITYLSQLYPNIITLTPDEKIPIFKVNTMVHNQFDEILDLQGKPQFSDAYDFYNAYLSTGKYKDDFNYQHNELYQKLRIFLSSIRGTYKALKNPKEGKHDVYSLDEYKKLGDNFNLETYVTTLDYLGELYENLISFNDLYCLWQKIGLIYGDEEVFNVLEDECSQFQEAKEMFNNYYQIVKDRNSYFAKNFLRSVELIP